MPKSKNVIQDLQPVDYKNRILIHEFPLSHPLKDPFIAGVLEDPRWFLQRVSKEYRYPIHEHATYLDVLVEEYSMKQAGRRLSLFLIDDRLYQEHGQKIAEGENQKEKEGVLEKIAYFENKDKPSDARPCAIFDYAIDHIDGPLNYRIEITKGPKDTYLLKRTIEKPNVAPFLLHTFTETEDYRSYARKMMRHLVTNDVLPHTEAKYEQNLILLPRADYKQAFGELKKNQYDDNGIPLDPLEFFRYAAKVLQINLNYNQRILFRDHDQTHPSLIRFLHIDFDRKSKDRTHSLEIELSLWGIQNDLKGELIGQEIVKYLKREKSFPDVSLIDFDLGKHSLDVFNELRPYITASFKYANSENRGHVWLHTTVNKQGIFTKRTLSRLGARKEPYYREIFSNIKTKDYRNVIWRMLEAYAEIPTEQWQQPGAFNTNLQTPSEIESIVSELFAGSEAMQLQEQIKYGLVSTRHVSIPRLNAGVIKLPAAKSLPGLIERAQYLDSFLEYLGIDMHEVIERNLLNKLMRSDFQTDPMIAMKLMERFKHD